MLSRHRLAEVAALLADPSRAGMLGALWDGRARPAGELARLAGIGAPTASAHLARLRDAGLVTVSASGRHRYFRLAGPEVAAALEALARLVPAPRAPAPSAERRALERARLCYDHLAGALGVGVTAALVERRILDPAEEGLRLGPRATEGLRALGVDVGELEPGRRPVVRSCLDWTERRDHLAGALGAKLAAEMLERDWLRRLRGSRALLVTARGRRELRRALDVAVD